MDLEAFANTPSGHLIPISGSGRDGTPWTHKAFLPNPLGLDEPELSPSTYRGVANARAALASLDATAKRLPNPKLFRHTILRLEAQSTAALEGTYEPLRKVLAADEKQPEDASMREVLNYLVIADQAFSWVEDGNKLSLAMLSQLQGQLMMGTPAEREFSGALRPIQVVIGRRDDARVPPSDVRSARFIPPPPGADLEARVRDLLDWMGSDHSGHIDPLIAAAMGHYQFETLHPFHDGNGRLGRLLIVVQLYTSALLSEPSISVSPWFEARRRLYYDALFDVSAHGDWNGWIALFADGIKVSADAARTRMLELADAQQLLKERVHASPLRGANALRLIDLAVEQPTFTAAEVAARLGIKPPGAHKLIDNLVALDVLAPYDERSYNRRFYAPTVLEILLAHAAPSG